MQVASMQYEWVNTDAMIRFMRSGLVQCPRN